MPVIRSATAELAKANNADIQIPLGVTLVAFIPGLFFQLLIAHFVTNALEPFTTPGFSLFQYKTSPIDSLSGNCLKEYTTLHLYWLCVAVYWVGQFLLQILIAKKPCKGYGVKLVGLFENMLNIFILYNWWVGFTLVLNPKTEDVKECEYLHNVAWWLWVAVPLFVIPVMLCAICAFVGSIMASTPSAQAREISNGLVVTPTIEEVSYEKLP